eukprot:NODE_1419_length_1341_cov_11.042010_g1406_i0.p1 GENE.NODE_1419_length_1341_cov_11.042010_g1406_i0~~NODE_1419_length_1341_cov_11.042010_g1406_i0.p1  ORF type:complete len:421 (+),score=107.90 NODE_1419_length_1341_cov_11.042010_g1406_i0:127-1263(+)
MEWLGANAAAVLDVREDEHAGGHVRGSVWVRHSELTSDKLKELFQGGGPLFGVSRVVTLCINGDVYSYDAAIQLHKVVKEQGITVEVGHLHGGFTSLLRDCDDIADQLQDLDHDLWQRILSFCPPQAAMSPEAQPGEQEFPQQMDEEDAAKKIQALQRGRQGREAAAQKRLDNRMNQVAGGSPTAAAPPPQGEDEEEAAKKIQALQRGRQGRAAADKKKKDKQGGKMPAIGDNNRSASQPGQEAAQKSSSALPSISGRSASGASSPSSKSSALPPLDRQTPLAAKRKKERPAYAANDQSEVLLTDDELRAFFEQWDPDCDGKIPVAAFKQYYMSMDHMGLEDVAERNFDKMLAAFKSTNDGMLTFEEVSLLQLRISSR